MMNPMQLMQMIRGGGNPQQAIINMMKQQSGNNPVIDNAINMMEKGDNAGIEKLARNLCKERNINPDDILSQVKNQFGIKLIRYNN